MAKSPVLLLLALFLGAVTAAPQPLPRANNATLDDVRFLLWTRSNPGDAEFVELKEGDLSTLGSFNGADPTVVLTHGFANSGDGGWPVDGKTELLINGPHNVIAVEWSALAAAPWYPTAVASVPQVGALVASLLDWLHVSAGMDPTKVQAVGHSLGAHLSGAIGQNLQTFRLPFITGLDPAGPDFYNKTAESRLDVTDADFVQIIHTNGCGFLDACVGLADVMGHVDFYPNGGEHQPGCTIGGDWLDLLTGGCSHGKCNLFWIESINSGVPFTARPCQDWATYEAGGCDTCGQGCLEMGYHVDRSLGGTYYLRTNLLPPYAQGPVLSQ